LTTITLPLAVKRLLLGASLVAGAAHVPALGYDTTMCTSVTKASINIYKYSGRSARFSGNVKRVLSSGIPLTVLVETDKVEWIAQVYSPDLVPNGAMDPGRLITVEGMIVSPRKAMVAGTSQQLVEVMVSKILTKPQKSVASEPAGDSGVATSVPAIVVNPYKFVGRQARLKGVIKRILVSGIPLKVLLTTNKYSWVAAFYSPDGIPDNAIVPGAFVEVEGMVVSMDPEMIGGTSQNLVQIMAKKVTRLKVPAAPPGAKKPAAQCCPDQDDDILQ